MDDPCLTDGNIVCLFLPALLIRAIITAKTTIGLLISCIVIQAADGNLIQFLMSCSPQTSTLKVERVQVLIYWLLILNT